MANDFNKDEVVLFDQVLEKFDADNTVAKEASFFSQPATSMQRQGDTVWRPTPQISTTVDGLDVSASIGSVIDLSVPASLSFIKSVPFELDALELRDVSQRDGKADSSAQALSAEVNRAIADVVGVQGSLVVAQASALTGYDDIALADTLMIENDVMGNAKTMVLNARDYNGMAGDLANRTLQPRSERALSQAALGPVAGFNTFKTSYQKTLQAAAGTVAVAGAGQNYTPVSTVTTATGTNNVDNRFQDLTVDTTVSVVAGDAFTLSGVNALSHINKADTGQLKTFRVVEVVDATTLKITPPIIDAGAGSDADVDYANVTATPADTTPLVFLNIAAGQVNSFWTNDSVEVFGGNLAFNDDMAGVSVMRQATDSGIEIIFAKQGDAKTGKAFYRLTAFFGVTNLNPEMNGILIGGQT